MQDEASKTGVARFVSSCRTCRLIERDGEALVVCQFPNGTELVYLSRERAALQREVEAILSGKPTGDSGKTTSEEASADLPPQSESEEDTRSPEEASADHVRAIVREAVAIEKDLPPAREPPVVLDLFLGELAAPGDLAATLEKVPTEPKHYAGATCMVSDLASLDAQAALKWLEEASKALSEYNAQEGWAVSVQCAPRAYQEGQFEKLFPFLDSEQCNVPLMLRIEPPLAGHPVAFGSEQNQLIDDIYMTGCAIWTTMTSHYRNDRNPDAEFGIVDVILW